MKLPTRIPRSTYRVQLHAGFNFGQLAAIIPYLHDLGISDVYLSPIFQAAPGSTHGYDVCDPNEINEELGGMEGLRKVSQLLKERDMGMLVDFVPNHMGIEGPHNWRWMDVLEHGRSSRFASFFDIHWNPRQTALQDRILIPVLPDFYGRVLESGDIRLTYADDAFWVGYFSLRFPLRPESYGTILHRLAWLRDPGSALSINLEKMADQFRALPKPSGHETAEEFEKLHHYRIVLRLELTALIEAENLQQDLNEVLDTLNGKSESPDRFDHLHQILEDQNYRLAFWKTGTHEINYRRFFAVDSLIGLRMESAEVFEESHRLLQNLIEQEIVTGVRIDHVDGLWDPAQYLERLRNLAGRGENPVYSLVEKILTEHETMPPWETHGTSGYDFTGSLINLLIRSKSESEFTRIYSGFTGMTLRPDEQAYQLKLLIMEELFPNAVDNLALDLEAKVKSDRRWRDWTVSELRPALARIIACLSVYRTYRVAGGKTSATDIDVVERAVAEALRLSRSSDPSPYHFIRDLWTGRYPDEKAGPELKLWAEEWISRLQQYTGAIMAKSVEDTLFYRYVRLFAANEVGHHPAEFGRPVAHFHEANQRRQQDWPAALLATSTHDTKMSEDVRARLLALSEMPERWDAALHRWSNLNHQCKTEVNNLLAPDANEEYLLYQILLGAWPLDGNEVTDSFVQRIKDYMRKALAEAKTHTNWATPDEAWLKACDRFIETILDRSSSSTFLDDFVPFAEALAGHGMKLSLVQTALKLTCPGVPDFYQGTELWDFSLVDPDNRRPVDYSVRFDALQRLDETSLSDLTTSWKDGRIKQSLIRTLLHYRREHPRLFSHGSYTPLAIRGLHANRYVAFLRQDAGQFMLVAARCSPGFPEEEDVIGQNLVVILPEDLEVAWHNFFGGEVVGGALNELPLGRHLQAMPVAIFTGSLKK